MQTVPALEGSSLAGRFADAFYDDLDLPATRWQRPQSSSADSTPAATEAMVRYLNLVFFVSEDGEVSAAELASLRAAVRRVIEALASA